MSKEDQEVLEQKIREGEEKERKERMKKRKEKLKKEKTSFIADFKAFITKGNVLDMAVGVVVGGAFGKITSGLVSYIINPVISLLTGGISLDNLRTPLGEKLVDETTGEFVVDELGKIQYEAYIDWGLWIQTIIDFLIIAFSIFVVIRLIRNTEKALKAKELEEQAAIEAQKKAEADAQAAADAEAAAQAAAAKKAVEDEFYANVKEQALLLREIRDSLNKKQ